MMQENIGRSEYVKGNPFPLVRKPAFAMSAKLNWYVARIAGFLRSPACLGSQPPYLT